MLLAPLALLLAGALPAQWEGDIDTALRVSEPITRRLRHIEEIGRWGGSAQVSDLRSALRDESPDIRRATLKAMMRMGPDPAMLDIVGILHQGLAKSGTPGMARFDGGFPPMPEIDDDPYGPLPELSGIDQKETAWAVRALSRSRSGADAVPHLMAALQAPDNGVREAALGGLQKITGLTQGAGREFLLPMADNPSVAEQAERWQEWWDTNREMTPEQWRTSALQAPLARDRAAAARAIAANMQEDAVPALIEAFRVEGDPLVGTGTSAVRQTMVQALTKLTGIRVDYRPSKNKDEPTNVWHEHHTSVAARYEEHWKAVKERDESAVDLLLASPEAKTRLHALIQVRRMPYDSQRPAKYLELMENDPSTAVQWEAYKALTRATCVSWPFEPTAPEDNRRVQLARWKDWFAQFGDRRAEGALSVFLPQAAMTWGMEETVPTGVRELEKTKLLGQLISIQSRAVEWIVIEKLPVAEAPLRSAFEEQLLRIDRMIQQERPVVSDNISSTLQRNLARAFGVLQVQGSYRLLVRRIQIAREVATSARRPAAVTAALVNQDVIEACITALGLLPMEGVAAVSLFEERLDSRAESSIRIRIASAYALARVGEESAMLSLSRMFHQDPTTQGRIAAAESMALLAGRHPRLRDGAARELSDIVASESEDRRLRTRAGQLVTKLAAK